jgi:hypothetical protein
MRNKIITAMLVFFMFSNLGLLYMYNQEKNKAEQRLYNLYSAFEPGIFNYYAHLVNAKEGRGEEHLLMAYADLHSTSKASLPLMAALGLPYEDVQKIVDFYSNTIKEWLLTDTVPTDEDYDNMISDLTFIKDTFTKYDGERLKDHYIIHWSTDELSENIDGLVRQLILYEE